MPKKQIIQTRNNKHVAPARPTKKVKSGDVKAAVKSTVIKSPQDSLARAYAKCMVSPFDDACRLPGAYGNQSSLMRTRRNFDIKVPLTGGAAGRFAFFVQPKIGAPDMPEHFQIGLVDYSKGVPTDLKSLNAYQQPPGDDLRVDPNSVYITQKAASIGRWAAHPAQPYDIATTDFLTDLQAWSHDGAKLDYNFSLGKDVVTQLFTIPTGTWLLTIHCTSKNGINFSTPVPIALKSVDTVGTDTTAYSIKALNIEYSVGQRYTNSDYVIKAGPNTRFGIVNQLGTDDKLNNYRLTFSPCSSPNYLWSSDNGIVESIRPVGCTVLATYMGSTLENAGTIVAGLSTMESFDKIFKVIDGSRWDNGTKMTGMSYDAKRYSIRKGAFVWWKPNDKSHTEFVNPEKHLDMEYPVILVAGEGPKKDEVCLTVQVEFCYEVIQNSQLFPKKMQYGNTSIVENVVSRVASITSVSENPNHTKVMKDVANILDSGARFAGAIAPFFF